MESAAPKTGTGRTIEKILANRTDLHLEYYPKMCGGYLLYDYSQRDPLTNEAKVYEIAMS